MKRINRLGRSKNIRAIVALITLCMLVMTGCTEISEESLGKVKGNRSGNTYSNNYYGFSITLDDDWSFSSEAELEEINGLKPGYSVSDIAALARKGQKFTTAQAKNEEEYQHIEVQVSYVNSLFGASENSVIKNDISFLRDAWNTEFGEEGFENERTEVTIDGKVFPAEYIVGTTMLDNKAGDPIKAKMYIKRVYFIVDNSVAVLSVASTSKDLTDEILRNTALMQAG